MPVQGISLCRGGGAPRTSEMVGAVRVLIHHRFGGSPCEHSHGQESLIVLKILCV